MTLKEKIEKKIKKYKKEMKYNKQQAKIRNDYMYQRECYIAYYELRNLKSELQWVLEQMEAIDDIERED
jgi:hypothetical protein